MKTYLIAYNGLLAAGWTAILLLMVKHFIDGGSTTTVYKPIEFVLKLSQSAAALEILHAMLGITRSSVLLTFFQVSSRLFVLWPVTALVPEVQNNIGVLLFVTCWTITEVIRYSFYALNLIQSVPFPILWCRYTLFIFLYPLGVTGELLTVYHCMQVTKKTGQFSIDLPNAFNFGFNYPLFLVIVMLMYIPIFPQLYFHMFAQRGKQLGEPVPKRD